MNCLRCHRKITGAAKYGLHEKCFADWFKIDAKNEFVSLKQRSALDRDPETRAPANNTSFYHGKFKKYSANLKSDNYILKMRENKAAPELPEVEYLCNPAMEAPCPKTSTLNTRPHLIRFIDNAY